MTANTDIATRQKRTGHGTVRMVLRILVRGYDRHLQRLDLSELSDDALKDIGLCRRDVERECAKPFWR